MGFMQVGNSSGVKHCGGFLRLCNPLSVEAHFHEDVPKKSALTIYP